MFYSSVSHRYLHSFPTRRSSDLTDPRPVAGGAGGAGVRARGRGPTLGGRRGRLAESVDRKSTRLNSSHITISYAVFCLKKKKHTLLILRNEISIYIYIHIVRPRT